MVIYECARKEHRKNKELQEVFQMKKILVAVITGVAVVLGVASVKELADRKKGWR